jgi:hypothetical protein
MTDKLQQTIKEELGKLPEEAKEAINSVNWAEIAEEIGKRYLLSPDEINNLQVETLLAIAGVEDYENLASNIESEVETTKTDAEKMAEEIGKKIIDPIITKAAENLKKKAKEKNPNWEQSVNFILSGGDYTAMMETRGVEESTPKEKPE